MGISTMKKWSETQKPKTSTASRNDYKVMHFNSVEHSCESLTHQSRAYSTGMEARPIKRTAHRSKWLLGSHLSSRQRAQWQTPKLQVNRIGWLQQIQLVSSQSSYFEMPSSSGLWLAKPLQYSFSLGEMANEFEHVQQPEHWSLLNWLTLPLVDLKG